MEELFEETEIKDLVGRAKRNCFLCMGRHHLKSTDKEKREAFTAVADLYKCYIDEFNYLRKEDASVSEINHAKENKFICLDLMDACKKCDMEVDVVNRTMNKLK